MYDISVMRSMFEDDFGELLLKSSTNFDKADDISEDPIEDNLGELVYLSWVHGDKQEANGDRYLMA